MNNQIVKLLCVGITLCCVRPASASLDVVVIDRDGAPVSDVVVYANAPALAASDDPPEAVMDQVDVAFAPHILVVQKGSRVRFPNSDSVAHHVYSFSKPNNFVLPLYKGSEPPPQQFEHEGVATLGCNIHDNMLGYIVVVDTPFYGMTDESGLVTLNVDDAVDDLEVSIWSPRIRGGYRSQLVLDKSPVEFRLKKRLRPPHNPGAGSSQDY